MELHSQTGLSKDKFRKRQASSRSIVGLEKPQEAEQWGFEEAGSRMRW